MRQRVLGYILTATAIIACPCHLAITLPIVIGLLGGTVIGATLAAHTGLIVAAAGVYFIAALTVGLYLIGRKRKKKGGRREACRPAWKTAPETCGRRDHTIAGKEDRKR